MLNRVVLCLPMIIAELKRRHQGCRAREKIRAWGKKMKPLLPSIIMREVKCLRNKMDEQFKMIWTQMENRESSIFCLTEPSGLYGQPETLRRPVRGKVEGLQFACERCCSPSPILVNVSALWPQNWSNSSVSRRGVIRLVSIRSLQCL